MPELKVECDCGQKYKFDVEPVNGRMPFTVSCPTCGVDGTPKANDLLQQTAGVTPAANPIHLIELPPIGAASTASAPPPVASAPAPVASAPASPAISSPTAPPAGAPKLRINIPAHTPAPTENAPPPLAPMAAPPVAAPPLGRAPGRIGAIAAAAAVDPNKPVKQPSFMLGIVGALLGSLIGGAVYYTIFRTTGIRLGLIAIGVGYLSGAGAQWLGKGEGSKELGGIAAIFALGAVIGAQYLVALHLWHAFGISDDYGKSAYVLATQVAKETLKQIPTGSDSEIRSYLAQQAADDSDATNTASISDAEVKDFKEKQLPVLQDLASGKTTKDEFDKQNGITAMQEAKEADREDTNFNTFFMIVLVSKINIISFIAAAGLAYKVCANA